MHNYFVFGFSFSASREFVPRILIAFATLRLFLTPEQKALKVVLISLMSYVFLSHSTWECKQIPVQYSLVHLSQHSTSSDGPSDVCRNLTNKIWGFDSLKSYIFGGHQTRMALGCEYYGRVNRPAIPELRLNHSQNIVQIPSTSKAEKLVHKNHYH